MARHKWELEHGYISETENYQQFKCRKCKAVKRNMFSQEGKTVKVLVQGNERLSSYIPSCTGYQFST